MGPLLSTLLSMGPSIALAAACGPDFSMSRAISEGGASFSLPPQAMSYYVCLSYAKDDPAPCGELKGLPSGKIGPPERRCRYYFLRGAFRRALYAGAPDAKELCARNFSDSGDALDGAGSPAELRASCEIMVRHKDDLELACREFLAWPARRFESLESCLGELRYTLRGIGGRSAGDDEEAPGYAGSGPAVIEALRAKDPKRCGGNRFCRALMTREEAVCGPYLAEAARAYCAPGAAPRASSAPEPEPMPRARPAQAADAGIDWVEIAGGTFMMGSTDWPDAKPVRRVTVKTFELAKTLVTNRQYRACVSAGACEPLPDWCGSAAFRGDDQPALCVSWAQAQAFSHWAGGRLPSEAEWEYAARSGGRERAFPWGDQPATCARAVLSEGGDGCGRKATWPVCSKPAGNTDQGLCDMAGNVWQWTQDLYHPSYDGAPEDGSAWEAPAGPDRVERGGSWVNAADHLRAARRGHGGLGDRDHLGFRPARERRR